MRVFNKRFISKYIRFGPKTEDIRSWKKFHYQVRSKGCNLLVNLKDYPDSVLVAGCQRSGTTILSRIIAQSNGMVNFWFGRDDELDAAQILSGHVERKSVGRYCFQTTYINECYEEYFNKEYNFKLIWVLRNPSSVIYSMMYNWSRFAFNELFDGVGLPLLDNNSRIRYEKIGNFALPKVVRACYAYNGKISQIFKLHKKLGCKKVMIVDYDDLVRNKNIIFPEIYKFIELPFNEAYLEKLHSQSINKAEKFALKNKEIIEKMSYPIYEKARKLIN